MSNLNADPSRGELITRFIAEGPGVTSFTMEFNDVVHHGHALLTDGNSVVVITTAAGIAYHKSIPTGPYEALYHCCGKVEIEVNPRTGLITRVFERKTQ